MGFGCRLQALVSADRGLQRAGARCEMRHYGDSVSWRPGGAEVLVFGAGMAGGCNKRPAFRSSKEAAAAG